MTYAGIDYGTSKVAIVVPEAGLWVDIVLRPGNNLEALTVIAEAAFNAVVMSNATNVVVESPIVGASRNMRVGMSLGMVAGALCVAVRQTGAYVTLAAPAEWKKGVTGRGNAKKEEVATWLALHYPKWYANCTSQDAIDATCLALYSKRLLDG